MHRRTDHADELIKISKKQILPDELLRRVWNLEDSEPGAGDEILEVLNERMHLKMPSFCNIPCKVDRTVFREILVFQPVDDRFKGLNDTVEIDRVENLTHSVFAIFV